MQNNSQQENAKYIEQLIHRKQTQLETTKTKLESINKELTQSGYTKPTHETKQIPIQLSQSVETQIAVTTSQHDLKEKRVERLQSIQEQIVELEKEIKKAQKLEGEISKLSNNLDQQKLENQLLQKKLKEKDHTVQILNSQISTMHQLEQNLTKMRYQLKQTEAEAEKFKSIAGSTKTELDSAKTQKQWLEESFEKLQTQSAQFQEMLKTSQQELEKLKEDVDNRLQPEILKFKDKVKEQEIKIEMTSSLNSTIKNLHQMVDQIKGENQSLRDNIGKERETLSEERIQVKNAFLKYQKIHAELVAMVVDSLQRGVLLRIVDQDLAKQTYGWAIQCILEDVKSGSTTEREMRRLLNTFDQEKLIIYLEQIAEYKMLNKNGNLVTVGEILKEVENKGTPNKDFMEDNLGLYRVLLEI